MDRAQYLPPWTDTSIIGVAGSSGSGKTSLALEIVSSLNLPWVVILSMARQGILHTSSPHMLMLCPGLFLQSLDTRAAYSSPQEWIWSRLARCNGFWPSCPGIKRSEARVVTCILPLRICLCFLILVKPTSRCPSVFIWGPSTPRANDSDLLASRAYIRGYLCVVWSKNSGPIGYEDLYRGGCRPVPCTKK